MFLSSSTCSRPASDSCVSFGFFSYFLLLCLLFATTMAFLDISSDSSFPFPSAASASCQLITLSTCSD